MGLAKTYSSQLIGLISTIITIEIDITNGLHSFSVIGLGDRAVEESKDRISAAIKNSGFISPKQRNQKVVISLAPADIKKEGPSFDLGMAIAYLIASNDLNFSPEGKLFLGELSLEGRLRKVSGILPILCQAKSKGFSEAFIPIENNLEASLAQGIKIYPAETLLDVIEHLNNKKLINKISIKLDKPTNKPVLDISYIKGNENAKRGLEIAAAGAHNIIMCGPPGTGKTMLAQSFPSILPDLNYEHAIEVTGIHSLAHILDCQLIYKPPFRSPHHTASYPSIIGGGTFPKPGEITLAHRGVLFLDEFPEFDKDVIEALRQPLEERVITISRAKGVVTFPAQCILVASMNPCPCGKGRDGDCICTIKAINSYKQKISSPIMDRIDLWINIDKIDYEKISQRKTNEESSDKIKERVISARKIQSNRFSLHKIEKSFNSEMDPSDIEKLIKIEDSAKIILKNSAKKMNLSGRAFHRIIKVAQTICDLTNDSSIKENHILEALQFRQKIFN